MRSVAALLLILALSILGGCGRKQLPQPPRIRLADPTRDLKVVQRDDFAILDWSYPSTTTDGGILQDVEKIEVWRVILPRGQEPTGSSKRDRQMKVQLIEAQGEILVELDTEGLEGATRGPKLHVEDDLTLVRSMHPKIEDEIVWYVVRTVCCDHRPSAFSNIARLRVELPPEPPESFTVIGSREGILISWPEDSEFPVQIERSPDGETWALVTTEAVDDFEWRDVTPKQGQAWYYRLRSVRQGSVGAAIIGEASEIVSVDHPDVYPPQTPRDLVCLPEGSRVRLRWVSGSKEVHFRIERRVKTGKLTTLTTDLSTNEYIDDAPPYGALVYTLWAVDEAENASAPISCNALIGAAP